MDQLPDSRRSILIALKQQGSATIAQLSGGLQLTGEAVRQQLLQLQRDGWIEAKIGRGATERGRTGRPATSYRLTPAGDHLFPKEYDVLAVAVIDAVEQVLGADATRRVLETITEARVATWERLVEGHSLAERVEILKSLYLEDDPYMDAMPVDGGYRLVERNCPFFNTAMHRPALCSVSVNALTRLLGVRVEREEKFQNGDGRCVFRVFADESVDHNVPFRLEAEMEHIAPS
ncbi:MAG TPA: winged helix-turn-helix transcriptional regulator [Thermoanaerobaculia bacterium]|nr:winged helix-turn-helix transcriptional regulator [Thermoanaerobaculia bacterium]